MTTFLDLKAATAELRPELDQAIARVLDSGQYILGEEVEAFEAEFAEYCGARECVGVASGFDALELILRGYGIGPGDEVIVPANTYIATWLAVSAVGARVAPVEHHLPAGLEDHPAGLVGHLDCPGIGSRLDGVGNLEWDQACV